MPGTGSNPYCKSVWHITALRIMYCCVSFYLGCILMDVVLSARQLWRPCTYQSDRCLAVQVLHHIHKEKDLSFPQTFWSHYLLRLSWRAPHVIWLSPSILQLPVWVVILSVEDFKISCGVWPLMLICPQYLEGEGIAAAEQLHSFKMSCEVF